jgi:hypothetical protein
VRKYCLTLGEAKTYAEIKTVELMNHGGEAVEFPSWLRVMAQQDHEQLEAFGKTIADAVAYPSTKAQVRHSRRFSAVFRLGKATE